MISLGFKNHANLLSKALFSNFIKYNWCNHLQNLIRSLFRVLTKPYDYRFFALFLATSSILTDLSENIKLNLIRYTLTVL